MGSEFSPSCASLWVYGDAVSRPFLPTLTWFSSHFPNVKGSLHQLSGFFQGKLFIYSWVSMGGGDVEPAGNCCPRFHQLGQASCSFILLSFPGDGELSKSEALSSGNIHFFSWY